MASGVLKSSSIAASKARVAASAMQLPPPSGTSRSAVYRRLSAASA